MNTEKKHYHHGDLRAMLLEITARIIAEEGVEKVTMRTLSQQAGVSRAAPYRHFPDKTALLCAVAADGFKKLENQVKKVVEMRSGNDALSCLADMAMAYVDFAVSNPSHYRLMFGREDLIKSSTPELRANGQAAFNIFFNVLQEVVRDWQHNNSSINGEPIFLTNVLWSTVHGLSMLLIDRQLQIRETITGVHLPLFDESTLPAKDTQKLVKLTVKTIIDGIKSQRP
jgi:AcrR family transcriptional regulator